jgi:hypothetical protein
VDEFWECEDSAMAISLEFAGVGDKGKRIQSEKAPIPINVLTFNSGK